jgi:hypothetical protein
MEASPQEHRGRDLILASQRENKSTDSVEIGVPICRPRVGAEECRHAIPAGITRVADMARVTVIEPARILRTPPRADLATIWHRRPRQRFSRCIDRGVWRQYDNDVGCQRCAISGQPMIEWRGATNPLQAGGFSAVWWPTNATRPATRR